MQRDIKNIEALDIQALDVVTEFSDDYSKTLSYYNTDYKTVDYYLTVGKSEVKQGWILHLSVIISEVSGLLNSIIPILIAKGIPFKIPMNKDTANNLLLGFLGKAQIGKIVSIYPNSDSQAFSLATNLINLTARFKGPNIPTDICIGNCVYTRYGSFDPVKIRNIDGNEESYIYDTQGQLITDPYSIPFKLLPGVSWPFGQLADPVTISRKKILKHIYNPLRILKEDVRGNVYEGVYLKSLIRISRCVIKEGNKNMASEVSGRDISDRLKWQYDLYHELKHFVPLPEIFDFFYENGNSYLVMEFINGVSLLQKRSEIIPDSKSWFNLAPSQRIQLLDYLIDISDILEKIHQKGYVHRDVVPNNFLVDKKNKVYLIDIELAYSFSKDYPDPPFEFGTAGFMSPQQQAVLEPTIKDDVYGFGALMIITFTGLSPVKFDTFDFGVLSSSLNHFIRHDSIASMVSSCVDQDPECRPSLSDVRKSLIDYRNTLALLRSNNTGLIYSGSLDSSRLKLLISSAIAGLSKPPTILLNDLWYSKIIKGENFSTPQNREYTRYPGIYEGISGVLYILAKAKEMNIAIDSGINGYCKGWEFIDDVSSRPNAISPGLYRGAAGIALAFAEGIRSGLISNTASNKQKFKNWLGLPNTEVDVADGIAGQGIAILRCKPFMDETDSKQLLDKIVEVLLAEQYKDGSWAFPKEVKKAFPASDIGFEHGSSGILWFLLKYGHQYQNTLALAASRKGLATLLTEMKRNFKPESLAKKPYNHHPADDLRRSVFFTLIKAYEVQNEPIYKKVVEEYLITYPLFVVKNNFNFESGLSGLGELYLAAWRAFKNKEWLQRAEWVASVLFNTFFQNASGSGYWKMEETNAPTADFMTGNSGIIHFLLNYINSDKSEYWV